MLLLPLFGLIFSWISKMIQYDAIQLYLVISSPFSKSISLFFFGSIGVWTQSFSLDNHAVDCMSHNFSPFCSGYFGDRVYIFTQAGMDQDPPILCCFLLQWGYRDASPQPAFFHWDGGLTIFSFLPGLSWIWNHSDLILLHNSVWKLYVTCPAVGWDGISQTFCLGWPQTMILLISVSQIARITAKSHQLQAKPIFLKI
jgi:hypothetical protein